MAMCAVHSGAFGEGGRRWLGRDASARRGEPVQVLGLGGGWPEEGVDGRPELCVKLQWRPAGAGADLAGETRVQGGECAVEVVVEAGEALGARNRSGSGVDGRRGADDVALLGFD